MKDMKGNVHNSMELPNDLRYALDMELAETSVSSLKNQAAELSGRYRSKQLSNGKSLLQSGRDADAYAAFRMPATYAAVYSSLNQIQQCLPQWSPETLLDTGAGPGTVMWAACAVWPALKNITLIEREDSMIALGKRLSKHSENMSIKNAEWYNTDIGDLQRFTAQKKNSNTFELVTSSYVLGEIKEELSAHYINTLWQLTSGVLLIIEPGTPDRFSIIKQAQELLISSGAGIIAPCPGCRPCPMTDSNWCHFSQRISRSRLHKQVKSADLSYEDEKFSFIAVARIPFKSVSGRVIRHPQVRKGHIIIEGCTSKGLTTQVVSRKEKEMYRIAKDLEWGSELPDCFT